MRKEATIEEWGKLYEAATKLKGIEPWNGFWDMDLIGIQNGDKEDTAFISILGRGGDYYGITVYEGYEGLNDFLMLTMQDQLNLTVEYAMFKQNNLTCYWGSREELSSKQREIIKQLGYKYRGRNQWLYFMSYSVGYFPYNMSQEEVVRMTEYLTLLIDALEYKYNNNIDVNFADNKMYLYSYDEAGKQWTGREETLPFTAFQFNNLILTDDELIGELSSVKKNNYVLEAELTYLGVSINDKKYDRPVNPGMFIIADSNSGMVIKADMLDVYEDLGIRLAEELIGFITTFGAPKEIRVSNVLVSSILEHICELSGTRLKVVKRLPAVGEFMAGIEQFM